MRLLFIVVAIISCAQQSTDPCELQLVADLPVSLSRNLIEVPGRINRSDINLVIDTGAARTVLSTDTVKSFLLAHSQHSATQLAGIGGSTVRNADVYADLELGGAQFHGQLAEARIPEIGGLVGGDWLKDYDVEFDLPHHRIKLWHAARCEAADLPWTGSRAMIPVDVMGTNQLRVSVTIDDKIVEGILDSGAALSVMPTSVAQRLGVTQMAMREDPLALVSDIDRGIISIRIHRFGVLRVDDTRIIAPLIGVGEMQFGSSEMLLGLDFLRSHRVWVSYRTRRMFVQ
jgi:hypothetical protein